MDKHVLSVKYSIFGRYDYIEATPENVTKIFEKFGPKGFIPNVVTLLKIIQPQNTIEQTLRPQLIDKKSHCVLTILPERVDIEFSDGVSTEIYFEYIEAIVKMFNLKISRIALNTSTGFDKLTGQELAFFNEKMTAPVNYDGEDNIIEYSSRRVSRKKADCINELINVGRNVTGISDVIEGRLSINRIQVDTDINTLAEFGEERFSTENCKDFFALAEEINSNVIDKIMVMSNEN